MAISVKIRDAVGNVVFDIEKNYCRSFGRILIPAGSTGSVTNTEGGQIWKMVTPVGGVPTYTTDVTPFVTLSRSVISPVVTVSGNVLSWDNNRPMPDPATQARIDFEILWGKYTKP